MKNPLKFVQEVKQEAFKVTWPTGKETLQGTLMVVAMAIIAAIFFLLLDQILKLFLDILLISLSDTGTGVPFEPKNPLTFLIFLII